MSFLARRLLLAPCVLLVVALATFAMVRLAKGGPFDAERELPAEVKAALAARLGWDRPLPEQFLRTLVGVADGSLPTLSPGQSVGAVLAPRAAVTATLGAVAFALVVVLGLGWAVLATRWSGSALDRALTHGTIACIALPSFVIGPVLAWLVGVRLGWLPPLGWGGAAHLVLPALTLAIVPAARLARLARAALAHEEHSDHVRTARAKGCGPWRVLLQHILRPALPPVVAYLGPLAAWLLTGSVAVELVFAVPGLGAEMVQAAINRDHNLVLALTLWFALAVVACNLLADLAVAALDPRVRLT
ncbi:MAG: ABC transporter permease [Planctomycetes bacterium]|nr:ABC transporter permease [Planctomycetota bacterium]